MAAMGLGPQGRVGVVRDCSLAQAGKPVPPGFPGPPRRDALRRDVAADAARPRAGSSLVGSARGRGAPTMTLRRGASERGGVVRASERGWFLSVFICVHLWILHGAAFICVHLRFRQGEEGEKPRGRVSGHSGAVPLTSYDHRLESLCHRCGPVRSVVYGDGAFGRRVAFAA